MQAIADAPPPSHQSPKRQRLKRPVGERASETMPLPGAGETRYHETRLALRWALYGKAPIQERTLEACCAKFGIDRATLDKAWREDGIEAEQARLMGIAPLALSDKVALGSVGMGDLKRAEAEKRVREGQEPLLHKQREEVVLLLGSGTLEAGSKAHTGAVSLLKLLNSMLAEITGLAAVQSLSLAAAKAQALKPQAPAAQERETRGVVVEL